MSAIVPKPLHLAKQMDELNTNMPNLKKFDGPELVKKCNTLCREAENSQLSGDQELAYIKYMQYLTVFNFIRKSPDYIKDPKYYKAMIDQKRVKSAFDQLEMLSQNLKQRYSALNKPPEARQTRGSGIKSSPAHATPTPSPTPHAVGVQDEVSIDVHAFLRCIKDPQVGVLVMDCRPQKEFAASHIDPELVEIVNVPAEIVKPGKSAGKIQCELSPEGKQLWASRYIKNFVVLMDWDSTVSAVKSSKSTTIEVLQSILLNWDPDVIYGNRLRCLAGGYECFMGTYPMYTTHSGYRPPTQNASMNAAQLVESIEYEDISDIQMKDTIRKTDPVLPTLEALGTSIGPQVDRSSKGAALQLYSDLDSKAKMLDQSISHGQETIAEWQAVAEQSERVPQSDERQAQIQMKMTELEYKLMEIDDQRETTVKELDFISRVIDNSPTNKGPHYTTNPDERSALVQARRVLHDKTMRNTAYMAERQQFKRRIEAKNELTRLRPPQPTFDRAAKPTALPTADAEYAGDELHEVVRYFQAEPGGEGPGLTGLKNLGNTCYMNSIMQCLSNTAGLRDFFVSDDGYRKQFKRTSKTQRQIADEVSAVMREIWLNKHRHIASNDLRRVVGQCKQIFRGSEQQDSHEFLTILMDWLHLDLQPSMDGMIVAPVRTPAEAAWQEFADRKESYIMKLFYGQIKSTVKCKKCKSESATFEGFSNLSLELPEHSNSCNITECLNMYFYGEDISGYNCPKCKEKRTAVKKLDISKLPPVLVIHFKRFNVDLYSSTATYKKKTNYVRFPLNEFDMSEYIAPSERQSARAKQTVFELYGVSNHYGEINRGHYTAFCKSSHYNKWYKYDDHNVSRMDPADVTSSAAYILFYATR